MEFKNPFFLPGRKDLLKNIHRRKTIKRLNKQTTDESEKSSKFSPVSNSSSANGSPASQYDLKVSQNIDEASYKGLVHTVLNLQQQVQLSQLALKQVFDELNYYRKAHYELEQKVNNITLQSVITNSGHASNMFTFSPVYAPNTYPLPNLPYIPSGTQQSSLYATSPPPLSAPFSSQGHHSNLPSFNLNSAPPNDITSFLFSEDPIPNNNDNLSATSRNSLLNLVNINGSSGEKAPTFDFNNLQQNLSEVDNNGNSSSNNNAPPYTNGLSLLNEDLLF